MLDAWRLVAAHFRREALEELSYRSSLALQALGGTVTLFSIYYLSRLVGPRLLVGSAEASYFDFGRKVNTFTPTAGGATFPIDIKDRTVVVKGGINWRFTAAPAITKF